MLITNHSVHRVTKEKSKLDPSKTMKQQLISFSFYKCMYTFLYIIFPATHHHHTFLPIVWIYYVSFLLGICVGGRVAFVNCWLYCALLFDWLLDYYVEKSLLNCDGKRKKDEGPIRRREHNESPDSSDNTIPMKWMTQPRRVVT